jgi:hypothetical protein
MLESECMRFMETSLREFLVAARDESGPGATVPVTVQLHAAHAAGSRRPRPPFRAIEQSSQPRLRLALMNRKTRANTQYLNALEQ